MIIHDRPNPINKLDKSNYKDIFNTHTKYVKELEQGKHGGVTSLTMDNYMGCKVRIRYIKRFYPEYAL